MADAVKQQKNLITCKARANRIPEIFYKLKDDVKYNGQKHLVVRGAQVNRHIEMPYRNAECIPCTARWQINCLGRGLRGPLLCLSISLAAGL